MAEHLKAPVAITAAITSFCRQIASDQGPDFVRCEPSPSAVAQECFSNVARVVASEGGRAQHGWKIYEWPETYLEAEFHAVWQRPDGTLVDVSHNDGDHIMFLPDSKRSYRGERVVNVQHPLSPRATVLEFINSCQELWRYEAARWSEKEGRIVPRSVFEKIVHFHLQRRRLINQYVLYDDLGLLPHRDLLKFIVRELSRAPSRLINETTSRGDW